MKRCIAVLFWYCGGRQRVGAYYIARWDWLERWLIGGSE